MTRMQIRADGARRSSNDSVEREEGRSKGEEICWDGMAGEFHDETSNSRPPRISRGVI